MGDKELVDRLMAMLRMAGVAAVPAPPSFSNQLLLGVSHGAPVPHSIRVSVLNGQLIMLWHATMVPPPEWALAKNMFETLVAQTRGESQ